MRNTRRTVLVWPSILRLPLIAFVLSLVAMTPRLPGQPGIPTDLRQAFAQNGQVDYLVVFSDSVDLSKAATSGGVAGRRQYVYDQLRLQAKRSQAQARAILDAAGIPYQSHYLLNALEVRSDLATAQQLAALSGVDHLYEVKTIHADLPLPEPPSQQPAQPAAPQGVEWGVARVHAPDVWSVYGIHGEGIVVGTADTGVQWDHPALQPHYRGWNGSTANHNYNWHDAIHAGPVSRCPNDSTVPCDGWFVSHGTHVTGTMVGDDGAGNQIGVAPGARWIACRNMDDNGDGSIARYTECFEFLLAPYPFGGDPLSDGRTDLAADIINNSWTCPVSEGCDSTHLNDMRAEIQKLNAAGILVVAASSNYGSSCSTVSEPIAIYPETFSIGATDSGDNIAGFSSRGPVTIDGSNRRKPDASAPGVSVRSSLSPNTYGALNGTSMASPHAAGVAALLWSAVPQLRGDVARTVALLDNSADHRTTSQGCGGDSPDAVPNNVFGYGILNAYTAIACAPDGLCLDKQASSSLVRAGDVITYVMRVADVAGTSALSVTVADRVPAGASYLAGSIAGPGADDSQAPVLHWNVGNVPTLTLTSALTLTFAVSVNAGTSGVVITNTGHIESLQSGPRSSNTVTSLVRYVYYVPWFAH